MKPLTVLCTKLIPFLFFSIPYQIRYEWVRDLLPRLHEVDSYSLSGWAEGKLTTRKQEADESKLNTALQAGFWPFFALCSVQ